MTWARMRALLCGLLAAGPALGETQNADVKRIEAMRARALADYDALEFDAARRGLLDALAVTAQAGLDRAPVAARVRSALAVVWIGGMRDRYRGLQELLDALRIDPAVAIDPAFATPEMLELLQNARDALAVQASRRAGPADAPGGGRREVRGLVHERIDEAWAGFAIPLRCELGADVPAARVTLFYRAAGREEFTPVAMRQQAGDWAGSIPERATWGRTLHYYIEARDRRDRAVAQDGSAGSPNLITIRGLNPAAPAATKTISAREAALGRRFTLAFGLGSGVGVLGASQSEHCGANQGQSACAPIDAAHQAVPVNSGAAPAPLHLLFDVGYRLAPAWEAAVELRLQVISGNQVKAYDDKSFLGTARIRRWFGEGRTRLYFAGAVGGGQITHGVDLGPTGGYVRDTLTSGKVAAGGGIGLGYGIAGGLAAVAAADALVLFPDHTAFHADLNLALRYAF
jgi:hypothetical protein